MTYIKTVSITRSFLFYCLFFICLVGCKDLFDPFDNKDKYFPVEEKYKIKFNQGDTLKYLDQHQNTFQLVISKVIYSTREVSRKGSGGPYDYIDRQTVYYDSAFMNPPPPPPPPLLPMLNIYTVHPDGHVIWEPGLYGRSDATYYDQIMLNSIVYNSVFKYSGEPKAPAFITTWYYSYSNGFIGFKLENGQLFTLTNRK